MARLGERATPLLIGDFQPYNQSPQYVDLPRDRELGAVVDGARWVGDLAVECLLESRGETGTVVLDLVEAGVRHTCTLDLATGAAALAQGDGPAAVRAAAPAGVMGRGRWRLLFANVDDELSLFVDGRRVTFPEPTTWRRARATAAEVKPVIQGARPGADEPDDLAPVGFPLRGDAAAGAFQRHDGRRRTRRHGCGGRARGRGWV